MGKQIPLKTRPACLLKLPGDDKRDIVSNRLTDILNLIIMMLIIKILHKLK